MSATAGSYAFSSLSGFDLESEMSYAVAVSSDSAGIKWGRNADLLPSAAGGFTYDGMLITSDSGENWYEAPSSDNALQIQILAVPEPSFFALAAGCAMLAWVGARRRR